MVSMVKGVVRQYRESHHRIAQMFALGCTPAFIRRHTGISLRRLTLLAGDPTFCELIAEYSKASAEKLVIADDTYTDLVIANRLRAEQTVADHFDQAEDEGELVPLSMANKLSMDRADRTGMGKNMTIDVRHDFASLLDSAIARSSKARVIEGTSTGSVAVQPPADTPALTVDVGDGAVLPSVASAPLGRGGPRVQRPSVPHGPIQRRKIA